MPLKPNQKSYFFLPSPKIPFSLISFIRSFSYPTDVSLPLKPSCHWWCLVTNVLCFIQISDVHSLQCVYAANDRQRNTLKVQTEPFRSFPFPARMNKIKGREKIVQKSRKPTENNTKTGKPIEKQK